MNLVIHISETGRLYMKESDLAPLILRAAKLTVNGNLPEEDTAAIKALIDKQIGKPVIEHYGSAGYTCPDCRYQLIRKSNHCPRCGQKLEWMLTDKRVQGKRR
jgi:DNA-directed RNA polymerase subunit RPC12/RpoP